MTSAFRKNWQEVNRNMAEKTSNYYDSLPYGRLGIIALDSFSGGRNGNPTTKKISLWRDMKEIPT